MSTGNKKKNKMSSSALNKVLVLQLVLMLGLSIFITTTISLKTRDNAVEHMSAICDERAHIIESYIRNAEKTLKNFGKAQQVKDVLDYSKELLSDNPGYTAKSAQNAAQAYTEEYGKDIDNLEGIWIGSWDTHVLTHTSAGANSALIGTQMCKDVDSRDELQEGMENDSDGLYLAGIMISPASKKQCISMYQAIYDSDGNPIGFVGLGVFTDGLVDTLNGIPVRGFENSYYSMADASSRLYIFSGDDESKIHSLIEDKMLLDICYQHLAPDTRRNNTGRSSSEDTMGEISAEIVDSGYYEYDKNGAKYVSVYTYIPDYNWIVTIDDVATEVFSLTITMIVYLGIFGAVILGLVIVFSVITKRQALVNQKLASTLAKNATTKQSLSEAMFKDVLTGADNRVSYTVNAEKVKVSSDSPCYFALFNVIKFSDINAEFGTEAGDAILIRIREILSEFFSNSTIYRTGSDEFLVVIETQSGSPSEREIVDKINIAFRQMAVSKEIENVGKISPEYKVVIGKKRSGEVDMSVITQLKKKMNSSDKASVGMIECIDLL